MRFCLPECDSYGERGAISTCFRHGNQYIHLPGNIDDFIRYRYAYGRRFMGMAYRQLQRHCRRHGCFIGCHTIDHNHLLRSRRKCKLCNDLPERDHYGVASACGAGRGKRDADEYLFRHLNDIECYRNAYSGSDLAMVQRFVRRYADRTRHFGFREPGLNNNIFCAW